MISLPPELKHLATIEARAKELETIEPAVAYWSRYWIVQKSIDSQKKERSASVEEYLMSVLEQLETMKSKHAGMSEIERMESGKIKVETFALQIFDNADREERAKRATRATSSKFLAAATFLEVCQVFGPPDKDLVDKRKYAKVQAMRIQSAIVAGRDPNVGKTKSNDTGEVQPTAAEAAELDALLQTTVPSSQPFQEVPQQSSNERKLFQTTVEDAPQMEQDDILSTEPYTTPPAKDSPSTSTEVNPGSYFDSEDVPVSVEPQDLGSPGLVAPPAPPARMIVEETKAFSQVKEIDPDVVNDAQKHAKWAISALNYEDITTAISELRKALEILGAA